MDKNSNSTSGKHREKVTYKQKKALLFGSIPSSILGITCSSLKTHCEEAFLRQVLKEKWQIKDEISLNEMLFYASHEGERSTYNIIIPHFLATNSKEKRRELLTEKYLAIDLLLQYSDNLSENLHTLQTLSLNITEEDLKKGIFAWDMSQIVLLSRIATDAGYLTKAKAWKLIMEVYKICTDEFSGWEEINKGILIGAAMKLKPEIFNEAFPRISEAVNQKCFEKIQLK